LPMERQQVLKLAKNEEYADLSHRILTVTAWDQNLFFMSLCPLPQCIAFYVLKA
jgi:hypothetical protein